MKKEIEEFYQKSEALRNGYTRTLNEANYELLQKFKEMFPDISEMFSDVYSISNGTDSDIKDQRFFDFIPGFRLMKLEEIIKSHTEKMIDSDQYDIMIPFLTDYAGCYYAYGKKADIENIVYISEEGIEVVHNSVINFWTTINAFYDEHVYYLDEDGYLSYDFDLEGKIGKRLNPQIAYWE